MYPIRSAGPLPARRRAAPAGGAGLLGGSLEGLDRSQSLQVSMRLKALDEIHTMHSFVKFCNLNFLVKFAKCFLLRFAKFSKSCSKNSSKFCRILSIFLQNLNKKCDWRAVQMGALCRSRRELSNAYLLAKFGFDTAENEPCEVCPIPRVQRPLSWGRPYRDHAGRDFPGRCHRGWPVATDRAYRPEF